MKRISLVAGYSNQHIIEDYVVYLLQEMAKFSDVYYLADNALPREELDKLIGIVQGAWAYRHGKYDFGSWQALIRHISLPTLLEYDNVILVNDSNYGPLFDMAPLFHEMEARVADFWGITENYGNYPHIQSYFMVLKNNIIASPLFYDFVQDIQKQDSKDAICIAYETGLSRLLRKNGFICKSYIFDRNSFNIPHDADITAYQNSLLDMGSPFVKRKIFYDNTFPTQDIKLTLQKLRTFPYPFEYFPKI